MLVRELDAPGGSAPLDLDVLLSGGWLTAALQPVCPGVKVVGATITERLETIATKVRFHVEYDDPAHAARALPADFCVKGYFGEEGQKFAGIGAKEARFYGELAPSLPVRRPPCYYAAIDAATGHGIVVMQDLVVAGATFLGALSPYRPDQVAATLAQLAALHASRWNDPAMLASEWLAPTFPGFANVMTDERLAELLGGPRGDGIPVEIRQPQRLKGALGALAARYADREQCLVHCDGHAGNLYEDADGPGLIDWQVFQRAHWSLDVAYHIGAVLTPDERERTERDLLREYLERLRAAGIDPPPYELAWEDYRASLTYGYFMWSITQRVAPDITVEFNRRLGTAVATHGSLDLLGV
jgi:hypothetical protein